MKICTHCKKSKPRDQFKVRTSGYLHSWCIACKREYDRVKVAKLRAAL